VYCKQISANNSAKSLRKKAPIGIMALLAASFVSSVVYAQGNQKSVQTYQSGVDYDGGQNQSKAAFPDLPKLNDGVTKAKAESAEMAQKLKTVPPTSCEHGEYQARKDYADFLIQHAPEISEIQQKMARGLSAQALLIRDYEKGIVEGKSDVNILISDLKSNGEFEDKYIPVKDLVAYIRQFESIVSGCKDSETAGTVALFEDQSTATNPFYFNMTLDEAKQAYLKLGTTFLRSFKEEQARSFEVGTGKSTFQVVPVTRLGYLTTSHPDAGKTDNQSTSDGVQIGTALAPNQNVVVDMSLKQTFNEVLVHAGENTYWDTVALEQITINGVPIDGTARRKYFDKLDRTQDCRNKGVSYTFTQPNNAGPYQSYDQKTVCHKPHVMEIQSAVVWETTEPFSKQLVSSGKGAVVTREIKPIFDGFESKKSGKIYSEVLPNMNLRSCSYVTLDIWYSCGCDEPKEVTPHLKADYDINLSCEDK